MAKLDILFNQKYEDNHKIIGERFVKAFLDLMILILLKDKPLCGYSILANIHIKFNTLLSPGTVYPLLYALEKEAFIKCQTFGRKRRYSLSDKGVKKLDVLSKVFETSSNNFLGFMNG